MRLAFLLFLVVGSCFGDWTYYPVVQNTNIAINSWSMMNGTQNYGGVLGSASHRAWLVEYTAYVRSNEGFNSILTYQPVDSTNGLIGSGVVARWDVPNWEEGSTYTVFNGDGVMSADVPFKNYRWRFSTGYCGYLVLRIKGHWDPSSNSLEGGYGMYTNALGYVVYSNAVDAINSGVACARDIRVILCWLVGVLLGCLVVYLWPGRRLSV